MKFSQAIWDYERAQCEFTESLTELGFEEGEHYERIGWDDYDNSIEFYKVNDDVRLNEVQQQIIFKAGFSIAFVNHKDGWETHYSWKYNEPFKPSRGWRRRWVEDPEAKTTRSVGENATPENAGYYEISYWPEGWTHPNCKDWQADGYMRIVPDPLEPSIDHS